MSEFLEFKSAYIEAMIFTDFHCDNEELEDKCVSDFSEDLKAQIHTDCCKFWQTIDRDELRCTRGIGEYTVVEQAGHDFWLTQNGHGAGFRDGDWPELQATVLTALSKSFGQCDLYVDDDGLVYSF